MASRSTCGACKVRAMQTVLITGATGLISAAAVARLGRHYTLRALNRRALSGLDCHRADIADLDASRPAFAGPPDPVPRILRLV